VVEKIVGEEFLKDLEITPALHFLRIAAHDRLRGLTQIVNRHDFVLHLFAACEQVGELVGLGWSIKIRTDSSGLEGR
jgi:hypothetical protein